MIAVAIDAGQALAEVVTSTGPIGTLLVWGYFRFKSRFDVLDREIQRLHARDNALDERVRDLERRVPTIPPVAPVPSHPAEA